MNIVVFGDSKAMPRGKQEGRIAYEETYPFLLGEKLRTRLGAGAPLVIDRAMRSRSIADVRREWRDEVTYRHPAAVVLQVGGSDCYPRVFLPRERDLIARIPIGRLREGIFALERRHRARLLRTLPARRNVPPPIYRRHLEWIARDTARRGIALILLPVIPLSHDRMQTLPGAREAMQRYNRIHDTLALRFRHVRQAHLALVRDGDTLPDALTVDGMHLNGIGADLVAEEIAGLIADAVQASPPPGHARPTYH